VSLALIAPLSRMRNNAIGRSSIIAARKVEQETSSEGRHLTMENSALSAQLSKAVASLVTQSKLFGTLPVVINVCNFAKPVAGQPALLNFRDVTTHVINDLSQLAVQFDAHGRDLGPEAPHHLRTREREQQVHSRRGRGVSVEGATQLNRPFGD